METSYYLSNLMDLCYSSVTEETLSVCLCVWFVGIPVCILVVYVEYRYYFCVCTFV